MTPPIRFLVAVVGGWTAARVLVLLPATQAARSPPSGHFRRFAKASHDRQANMGASRELLPALLALQAPPIHLAVPAIANTDSEATGLPLRLLKRPETFTRAASLPLIAPVFTRHADAKFNPSVVASEHAPLAGVAGPLSLPNLFSRQPPPARLTGSAWVLARGGSEAATATNGLLGGSQAGARVLFRLNDAVARPLSLSARLSTPLRRDGAEAAVGVEWQPLAGVPIRLLAERRQRLTGEGRSAFALLVHGGVSDRPIAAGLRLDAYAQAGGVGASRRDLFADGGATLVRPLGSGLAIGAGAWAGAQPGATRLDIGPRITAALPGATLARVSLDWRFRVAGGAAPSSGPSLTISTGF